MAGGKEPLIPLPLRSLPSRKEAADVVRRGGKEGDVKGERLRQRDE